MKLFCFASRNEENIRRGVAAKRWAVSTASDATQRSRVGKANKYLEVGDVGLLYCRPTHSFTVPFIVSSRADPREVVRDIWPEPWVLPFAIQPLGDLSRQIAADAARGRWPIVARRWPVSGGITAAMNVTGVTVFSPVEIEHADWAMIMRDLSTI